MPRKEITYKNHCTPQEQVSSGGRYYRGRKFTGTRTFTLGGSTTLHSESLLVTESPRNLAAVQDFIFIKNRGGNDVYVSLNNNESYKLILSKDESLALELESTSLSNVVFVKTDTDKTSTIEYYKAT